jgi:hypothetical protein
MEYAREGHGAAALPGGKVLICGGRRTESGATEFLKSCEIFTAATSTSSELNAGELGAARAFLSLTATESGRVYAVGGEEPSSDPKYRSETWLFNPTANGAERAPQVINLTKGRSRHSTSWLPGAGALVVVGGFDGGLVQSDEVARSGSDGVLGAFLAVGPPSKRINHTATVLSSGDQLLVTGGGDPSRPDFINSSVRLLTVPATGSPVWTELKALPGPGLADHSATLLSDGRVFIAGGRPFAAGATDAVLIYDPRGGGAAVVKLATMSSARFAHAAVLMQDDEHDKVIVTGGETADGITNSVEVYDPELDVWFPLRAMNVARKNHLITLLDARHALITGGIGADLKATDSAEVFAPRLRGEACDADGQQCLSGHCVDGVCCDKACEGACDSCNQSGSLGTCRANVSGRPVGERSCAGGFLCDDGVCLTTCSTSDQCLDDLYCNAGNCSPRLPLKSHCEASRDCLDGVPCVDGYCCDSPCDGICEACGEPGSHGKCVPVSGEPRGARPLCGEPSGECGLICDGAKRSECDYTPTGEGCGEDRCEAARFTKRSICDGIGNCGSVAQDCTGAFACDAEGLDCRSDCRSDEDCAGNAYTCNLETTPGVCVFKPDVGKHCGTNGECSEGLLCTDGVCCAETCPDDTWSCATPTHEGICRKRQGEACDSPSDCGSDFCVLGVCCESECSGQCETCNADDHAGECRPRLGDPEPRRKPCDDSDELCAQRSCDGKDNTKSRTSCEGLRNVGVSCEAARCDGNSFVSERRCTTGGVCGESKPQPCALDACTLTGCSEHCSTDHDCASEANCRDGECVPAGAYCKDDRLITLDAKSLDCQPYACAIDHCLHECNDSAECAAGFVCDDISRRCTSIGGGKDDGCGCSLPGSRRPPLPSLALLTLLAGLLRRRQRKSSAATALMMR